MTAFLNKYHIGINGKGYLISQRGGRRYYQKKRAPTFVNKFGGGDASYRDSSFWQFFVQTNWRNGSKQLKFDDQGKFWKSENVDTTQLEELSLSKQFVSVGQLASGVKANAEETWRSSTSWWNMNYGYRQQITITNPGSTQLPIGYPTKITLDTAALESSAKLLASRNDWRVLYFNGSSWVDLKRDYINTTTTYFPIQSAIPAGASDSNYYVYYGYAAEATNNQPTSESDWNSVYPIFEATPDSNSIGVWHFREGTGTSINDDTTNAHTLTLNGSTSWGTDGLLGRYVTFSSTGYAETPDSSDLDLSTMTFEALIYKPAGNEMYIFTHGKDSGDKNYMFKVDTSGRLSLKTSVSAGSEFEAIDSGSLRVADDTWTWVACTYDANQHAVFLINGVVSSTVTIGMLVPQPSSRTALINAYKNSSDSYVINGNNRIQHLRVSNIVRTSFPYHIGSSFQPNTTYGSETTTQPPSTNFDLYVGGSDGIVYKWDGNSSFTPQFDTRKITWYETGNDTNKVVGDTGGTETAQAMSFQVSQACSIAGIEAYLKKSAGTPGNITVRIETNSAGVPSGVLVDSNATATISAFTTSSYGWISVELAGSISLSAATTYWLVLKTAAAANDNNYSWGADASAPTYASGNMAASTDGGSTWLAVAGADALFRIKGGVTSVNCLKVSSLGGTQRMYVGTGNPTGQVNGDARLYSFDGSSWALSHIFNTTTESMITWMEEYIITSKMYFGVGPQAKVYETSDFSTFTLSKDINIPQNPGYIYAMKEYNSVLHVGGGSPEFLPTKYYNGFLNLFDSTQWRILYPFDFTVVKSLEFYDAFLFIGTYRGDLYVYDTSALNPLFNFRDLYKYNVEIRTMKYFDDKLYIGTYPQEGTNDTNVGIWLFDRRGISLAHTIPGVTGYRCFTVANGALFVGTGDDGYIYKLDSSKYVTQGWLQSSYFDANLPSIDKLYNNVVVRHDPLLSGQSIAIYYKFKETDAWTFLGVSNVVGSTEATLSFPTAIYSKKISIKSELNTTDTSSSPKLTETVLKYALYPDLRWQWNIRILIEKDLQLLDNTGTAPSIETRTPSQIRADLESLLSTRSLFTLTDVDGSQYNVIVNDEDQTSWVINQDSVNENEIIISLLQA